MDDTAVSKHSEARRVAERRAAPHKAPWSRWCGSSPRDGGQLGRSPDRPPASALSGQCATKKTQWHRTHSQGVRTLLCMCTRVGARSREEGKAKHGRTPCPASQSTGPRRADTVPSSASYTGVARRLQPLPNIRTRGKPPLTHNFFVH